MSAAPVLATFSADVTGSDISVKEINPNQFSVEKIRGGSKTAVNGVRQKDLLLRIGNQFVLDIGIHGVRKVPSSRRVARRFTLTTTRPRPLDNRSATPP